MPRVSNTRGRMFREGIGLLLLATACGSASTSAEAEIDDSFVLSEAVPTAEFEATYCLEDSLRQSILVSAEFSVELDGASDQTVTLALLDTDAEAAGGTDDGDTDGLDTDGESSSGDVPALDTVDVRAGEGRASLSLQDHEDWSEVRRRCATARIRASAEELEAGQEVRLTQPRVRVLAYFFSGACEEPVADTNSFSIEFSAR